MTWLQFIIYIYALGLLIGLIKSIFHYRKVGYEPSLKGWIRYVWLSILDELGISKTIIIEDGVRKTYRGDRLIKEEKVG